MARGINKVFLIGNLGMDPSELRFMPETNKAVLNLNIATTEGWKDRQTGELRENTEWHRVVLYDRLAEVAKQYLRKGSKIWIEGRLKTRKWTDKEGIERFTTEIVANDMQMLDSRGGSMVENESKAQPSSAYSPSYSTSSTEHTTSVSHAQKQQEQHSEFDDIPF